jgi:biopolymer transport protein ExbD
MNTRPISILARRPSGITEACEIDVTPIMNMFIILIPFLVSMAVFAHLATHAFSLPADDGAGQARTAAELPVTVAVAADRIVVAVGDRTLASLPVDASGEYDQPALLAALRTERARRPDVTEAVVAVDDDVVCADVVRCLDQCQDAGFADVGLAGGTNLDRPAAEVSP